MLYSQKAIGMIHSSEYNANKEPIFKSSQLLTVSGISPIQKHVIIISHTINQLGTSTSSIKPNHDIHNYNTRRQKKIYLVSIWRIHKKSIRHSMPHIMNNIQTMVENKVIHKYLMINVKYKTVTCVEIYCNFYPRNNTNVFQV